MRATGHARVNPNDPRAFAVCDRCGRWYNHYALHWSFEWSGPQLMNQYLLVCDPCDDVPQEQLRTIVLQPDPPAILNARPEPFIADGSQVVPGTGEMDFSLATGANTGLLALIEDI